MNKNTLTLVTIGGKFHYGHGAMANCSGVRGGSPIALTDSTTPQEFIASVRDAGVTNPNTLCKKCFSKTMRDSL